MDEMELLKTINKFERRIEALEKRVYDNNPSDIIACSFESIAERRWKDKDNPGEWMPLCPGKKEVKYVIEPVRLYNIK